LRRLNAVANDVELGMLGRQHAVLALVDVQERFRPAVFEFGRVVKNACKLVEGFRFLDVPVIYTEQYPRGLGATASELKLLLEGLEPTEKVSFSCFGEPSFVEALEKLGRKNLVLAGLESHVCILKTALDALSRGFRVHVALDAVSSIRESDYRIALERLRQSGAFMASSEMLLFQLLDKSTQPEFKRVSEVAKKYA